MTAPLSHYFIYTGHNSYLTGNQFSSDSSVKPIIDALKLGVRVIELDLWPNSTEDDVVVCHGGTLTSSVALLHCLKSIKVHAFSASDYPVIITFEDHLKESLQRKVAKMVTVTFGDMLYQPKSELKKQLPSPESLKRKILISTKPPKEFLESQNLMRQENLQSTMKFEKNNLQGGENFQDEDVEVPEYRKLIAIHARKLKGPTGDSFSIDLNNIGRLSMSELEFENAARIYGANIVRFTQHNLLRIYPKVTRVDSSNYNPLIGWMRGAQLVALNTQGHGKHLWIAHGMFRANGGCGYVKKPDFLLNSDEDFVLSGHFLFNNPKKILEVTVYMGQGWHSDFRHTHFDKCSPPDLYARIGIAGVPADTSEMKETQVISDDWTPTWNERFEFELLVPELAVLRIEVKDDDRPQTSEFAGQTYLPVMELRTGIRSVPLHSESGERYKHTRLLMRFQFI